MRELKLNVLDESSIRELAVGHSLKLVFGNVAVAEIIPIDLPALADQQEQHRRASTEAHERLLALMNKGFDLDGLKLTNRDEVYDRDKRFNR